MEKTEIIGIIETDIKRLESQVKSARERLIHIVADGLSGKATREELLVAIRLECEQFGQISSTMDTVAVLIRRNRA
jgi:hypothetical protein